MSQTSVVAEFFGGPIDGEVRAVHCPYGGPPVMYHIVGEPPPIGPDLVEEFAVSAFLRGDYQWSGGWRRTDPIDGVVWTRAKYQWTGWAAP